MEAKIKVILMLLFSFGFLFGCLPSEPSLIESGNRSERHSSREGFEHSGSSSEADQREIIRTAQEERIAKGQEIVEVNIEYLRELKKNNERILQSRAEGVSAPPISEIKKKKLQKAAKERHFKNLESLLEQ